MLLCLRRIGGDLVRVAQKCHCTVDFFNVFQRWRRNSVVLHCGAVLCLQRRSTRSALSLRRLESEDRAALSVQQRVRLLVPEASKVRLEKSTK